MFHVVVKKYYVSASNQIRTVTGAKRMKYLMNPEGVMKCIQAQMITKDDDHCDRIFKIALDKFVG